MGDESKNEDTEDSVEFDESGECDVCGVLGVYIVPDIGRLCPECAETFVP